MEEKGDMVENFSEKQIIVVIIFVTAHYFDSTQYSINI